MSEATDPALAGTTLPGAVTPRRRDVEGNRRLLAWLGVLLVGVLGFEYLTLLLGLRQGWIATHIYVGLVLVPVVAWKLAIAGYRFARYYTRDADYRAAGPPRRLLRIVAPVLAAAGVVLLGSGVLLVTSNAADRHLVQGLHKLSYAIFTGAIIVHLLGHASGMLRRLGTDIAAHRRGLVLRVGAVAAIAATGLAFAQLLPHDSEGDRGRFDRRDGGVRANWDHRPDGDWGGDDH